MVKAALDNYQQTKISTAEPGELMLITYEVAIKAMRQAERAMKKGEATKSRSEILRAVAAVIQLDEVLDVDAAPIGPSLRQLYGYLRQRLLHAASAQDVGAIKESIDIMSSLYEAWQQVVPQEKA